MLPAPLSRWSRTQGFRIRAEDFLKGVNDLTHRGTGLDSLDGHRHQVGVVVAGGVLKLLEYALDFDVIALGLDALQEVDLTTLRLGIELVRLDLLILFLVMYLFTPTTVRSLLALLWASS